MGTIWLLDKSDIKAVLRIYFGKPFFRSAVLWIFIGLNADPDPAFYLNMDPDPGSQTNVDQCGKTIYCTGPWKLMYKNWT